MKIWIDLTNSPHINFFKPFIKYWKAQGYEIIITARDLSNTISLINQNNWQYSEIGGHAGKNKIKKILYFPKRVLQLWSFLNKEKPDIGISHSSFYSPFVCRMLRIPSIYLNDNEHAKGNYLAFKSASLIILPEFLKKKAEELNWTRDYPITFYPGIKEGIYLSQSKFDGKETKNSNTIFIRLEPWTAQYYSGDSRYLDPIIEKLGDDYKVVILPRSKEQIEHFSENRFSKISISKQPISLEKIYNDCLLFIGAGGSMTRELAFLGTPTLSIYQGELLEVDKFLIENKFMEYNPNPKIEDITALLQKSTLTQDELSEKGAVAFDLINNLLKKLLRTE